ncbi:hypothetical protein, partial [Microtetraspora fusca]|uniref:hypothetical protein n=1 Tax=Microtetraspora fusca TaxID=1997 RepID=UPI001C3F2330
MSESILVRKRHWKASQFVDAIPVRSVRFPCPYPGVGRKSLQGLDKPGLCCVLGCPAAQAFPAGGQIPQAVGAAAGSGNKTN